MSRVRVGDGHITQRQPIKKRLVVVVHVIKNHSLALVEADFEIPLLPADQPSHLGEGLNGERHSLRLDNLERLEVCPQRRLRFGNVLIRWPRLPRLQRLDLIIEPRREDIDANNLESSRVDDRRDRKRERIMARVRLRRVIRIPHVQKALHNPQIIVELPALILDAIRSVNPGIDNNLGSLGKLQLGNFSLHLGVREKRLLHSNDLLAIAVGMLEGSQLGIAFDRVLGQVDDGFVDVVGAAEGVNDEGAAVDV